MGNRFRGLSVAIGMVLFTLPSIAMGETRWFHVDDPENYTLRLEPRVWFATESTFDGSFDFDTGIGPQAVAGIDTSLNPLNRFPIISSPYVVVCIHGLLRVPPEPITSFFANSTCVLSDLLTTRPHVLRSLWHSHQYASTVGFSPCWCVLMRSYE